MIGIVTEYVERHVGAGPVTRVVLENGWLFGLRHYPSEVISTPPPHWEAMVAACFAWPG